MQNFTFLGIDYFINIDFPFPVASMVVSLPNLARTDVPFIVAVIALGLSSNFFFLTRLGCSTPAYSHASSGSPVSESVVVDVAGRLTAAPSRLNTDCSCNHIELMHMLRPFYSPLTKWRRWFSVMCVCLSFSLSVHGESPCDHYLDLIKNVHLGPPLLLDLSVLPPPRHVQASASGQLELD